MQAAVSPHDGSSGADNIEHVPKPPEWKGWVLAVALGLCSMAMPMMLHHHKW